MGSPSETDARPEDELIGRRFGDFVVLAGLGGGSFGTVYLARQELLGRQAALKVLHQWLGGPGEASERFLREAQTASRLDHPYAAHVYASGAEPDGTLWIAMEYVRGTPFSEYLSEHGALAPERLLPFLERLCEVVQSAHEEGIVHRDIKPANVMVLSRAGRLLPKLLDFGVAKAVLETTGGSGSAVAGASAHAGRDAPNSPRGDRAPAGEGDRSESVAATLAPEQAAISASAPVAHSTAARARDGASMRPSGAIGTENGASDLAETAAAGAQLGDEILDTLAAAGEGSEPSARELTRHGQIVGSPHYMAPEQWEDSAAVGAGCDIYALGVLAYEALTGARPFQGRSIRELSRAHCEDAPPPVPESLPRELDPVFARALAKRPEDRYGTALELARAFRQAAGLASERPPLPRLDEPIRERFVAEAPQPLAEAVATLDAAREPRQARDALWGITSALAHYLGLLAVAARSRFGSRGRTDIPAALRRAGAEVLAEEQWLEIAEALARPYRDRPDLHPVPELVQFFGSEEAATGADRFRALWHLRGALASAAADDEALRDTLADAMVRLSSLLGSAAFVCDYKLALPAPPRGATCFIGARRAERPSAELSGSPPPEGEPALLDADNAPILSLYPLVQILSPAPGEDPEVFLFAGGSERGGKLVATPRPFERHDREVLDWLRVQLDASFESRGDASGAPRRPYRGLEAFTPDDASLYVGREEEVDGFANRLRVDPLVAVVGPSGAGKSSFIQAGVIPALRERDRGLRTVIVRPGAAPLSALSSRLEAAGVAAGSGLSARLRAEPELLGERLRDDAIGSGSILLVIDQLEEIFTLTQHEEERRAFCAAVASAARAAEEPVRVVLTLRDDFLVRAEGMAPLRTRLAQGLHLLTTPGPRELERILVEPASRAGYEFEDPELPARMVAEVEGEPGALAFLSFTASMLWEARDRHFRRIPTKAYEELGGVAGALSHHAESLLASLPQTERRHVREAFRLLVTGEGTRALIGRQELLRALGASPEAEAAIEHLVSGRLLVISEGEAGEQIEIAHEALLTAWPRLVEWRREDAEGARLRDQLRAAALQWDRRGRPRGLLWRDDALAEYRRWRERYAGPLTEIEGAFATASLAEERRSRRRKQGLVAAAFAVLAAGTAVLFTMSQRADEARAVAEEQRAAAEEHRGEVRQQLLDSYLEHGRAALREHAYFEALVYLAEAYEMGARGPEEEFILSMAAAPFEDRIASSGHEGTIWRTSFSPSGETLIVATSGGEALLRSGRDGELMHALRGHEDEVFDVSWHPEGRVVATASWDGTARVWDVETGEELAAYDHEDERVFTVSYDAGGERLVTGTIAGTLRVFPADPRGPSDPVVIEGERGDAIVSAAHPGGDHMATAGGAGVVRIWDLETGAISAERRAHAGRVESLAFDAAGEQLVSAGHDGTAQVIRTDSGEIATALEGHDDRVSEANFSPGASRVVTASDDGTARVWDADTGEELARLKGHRGRVGDASFHPDGSDVITAGDDGTARRWDPATGALMDILPVGVGALVEARYSPDGERIAVAVREGVLALWERGGALHRVFAGHEDVVRRVRYGGDVGAFVSASEDGTARVWAPESGEAKTVLEAGDPVRDAALGPSGPEAATVDARGGVVTWDLGGDGERKEVLPPDDPQRGHVRYSPSGDRILVDGAKAGIYDVKTKERKLALDEPGVVLRNPSFSPDGDRILIGDHDGVARIFDAKTGDRLHVLEGHGDVIFGARVSPTGEIAATGSRDGTARLWDMETGEELAVLRGHDGWIEDLAFAPDGNLLATAGGDRTIRIWGLSSRRELARLVGHGRSVRGLAFSPDGNTLVSGSEDQSVRAWPLPIRAWSQRQVEDLRRCLPLKLRDGQPAPQPDVPDDCQ